jgi:hypothetical protein
VQIIASIGDISTWCLNKCTITFQNSFNYECALETDRPRPYLLTCYCRILSNYNVLNRVKTTEQNYLQAKPNLAVVVLVERI